MSGAVKRVTGTGMAVAFELGEAVEVEGPAMLSEEELLERLKTEFGAEEVFDDDPVVERPEAEPANPDAGPDSPRR